MQLTLAMHSSPRFSTWIWIPDWHLLVDAGDGVTQQLGYKIRKVDVVALTHSHRDHNGGLLQVINQRGEAGGFVLAHPVNDKSWKMLESFANRYNPGTSWNAVWRALEEGDWIDTGVEGRLVRAFRTRHYADDQAEAAPRSLGFHCVWRKRKVLPQYRDLPQKDLDELRLRIGVDGITGPVDEKHVTIGGDGCPLRVEDAAGSRLLLHEATFLNAEDYDADEVGEDVGHVHSTVTQAVEVAARAGVPHLVLYHISTRYTDVEIKEAVRAVAAAAQFPGKIWAALPRRVYWDILKERPLWDGVP